MSHIGSGLLALVGLHESDAKSDLEYCARKLCAAKLWDNENNKSWRKSVKQMGHEVLLVSQFTLYGDISNKKHVPDFKQSMTMEEALTTYGEFRSLVAAQFDDDDRVKDGVFGAVPIAFPAANR